MNRFITFLFFIVSIIFINVGNAFCLYPDGLDHVSSTNSFNGTLAAGATFFGGAELNSFPEIFTTVLSDKEGERYVDFSGDGLTWPSTLYSKISSGTLDFHRYIKAQRYFRIRYVNSSNASASVSIYTYTGNYGALTSPNNSIVDSDADTLLVRNANNPLFIAQGKQRGQSFVNKFGKNPDINTATTPEDVWSNGGTYTGHPISQTTETVSCNSDSASDSPAGTGARTIYLYGLKSATASAYETELLALNGVLKSTSTSGFWRVNRIWVSTAGSAAANVGNISCYQTLSSGNVFGLITAGYNQTRTAVFTIPRGVTGYLTNMYVILARSGGTAGSASASLRARPSGGVYNSIDEFSLTNSVQYSPNFTVPIPLQELTDVKLTVDVVSDNSSIVSGSFTIILVEN